MASAKNRADKAIHLASGSRNPGCPTDSPVQMFLFTRSPDYLLIFSPFSLHIYSEILSTASFATIT